VSLLFFVLQIIKVLLSLSRAAALGLLLPLATLWGSSPKPIVNTTTADVTFAKQQSAKKSMIVLENATPSEKLAMDVLQARGINSTNALATVLGNIKQESMFHSNICEGGARINYGSCRRGGYGLIQWTTSDRYAGLGRWAKKLKLNPSSFEAQLSYMFQEAQWKKVEPRFKVSGHSIGYYMRWAHNWIGWGKAGHRTAYAYEYARRMKTVEVPVVSHPAAKFTKEHHYLK